MKFHLIKLQSIVFCLGLLSIGCNSLERSTLSFSKTPANKLAEAVQFENIAEIEMICKRQPELLNFYNNISGGNVLFLALHLEKYESFKKLIELGADVNSQNIFTRSSVLIAANKYYYDPEPYTKDLRYINLLLKYGADPDYAVTEKFTDQKGYAHYPKSPLTEAAGISLAMVKLLIDAGADPHKKLGASGYNAFYSALIGATNEKYLISNYFIDSLNADVLGPVYFPNDTLYIQDIVTDGTIRHKIREPHLILDSTRREQWAFILKLKSLGVDFENYRYKEEK